MSKLEAFNFFILRTPLVPFSEVQELIESGNYKKIFSSSHGSSEVIDLIREALRTSSPDFYEMACRNFNYKAELTLIRYLLRMSSRPTPYGLFAGYSVGKIGSKCSVHFSDKKSWKVYSSRQSNLHLSLINQTLAPAKKYSLNPSLRISGNVLSVMKRVVSQETLETKEYKLVTMKTSKDGIRIVKDLLKKEVISQREMKRPFLGELLRQQIVVPHLQYENYFTKHKENWRVSRLGNQHKSENVVLKKTTETCELNEEVLSLVGKGIETLLHLFSCQFWAHEKRMYIGTFCSAFEHKYLDSEIPLLDALDPVTGVLDSKGPRLKGHDPLIENFDKLTAFYQYKILSSDKRPEEWVLTKNDLEYIRKIDTAHKYRAAKMPSSVLATVERLADGKAFLRNVTGAPGHHYLSRFAVHDVEVEKGLKQIANHNKKSNPDIIFAEIIEFPKSKNLAAISNRKILTEYVIPLEMPLCDWPQERQLLLSDLLISVNYGRIRIRSRKLNREIMPILSSGYNCIAETNVVFVFLASIASQDNFRSISWKWNELRDLPYIPRVRMGNLILSPRQWRFSEGDVEDLKSAKDNYKKFMELKNYYGIPDRFLWVMNTDQRLLIDCSQEIILKSVLVLFKTKIKQNEFFIEECFENDQREYLIPFKNTAIQKQDPFLHLASDKSTKIKTYYIGEECVYIKIYVNTMAMDHIMANEVNDFVLAQQKHFKFWFFLRYADPEPHLRIRFFLKSPEHLQLIMNALVPFQKQMDEKYECWKFQIESYRKDLDTKGTKDWTGFDQFSHIDSLRVLELLNELKYQTWEEDKKWLYLISLVDHLLRLGFKEEKARMEFVKAASTAYETMGFKTDGDKKQKFGKLWKTYQATTLRSLHEEHLVKFTQPLKRSNWNVQKMIHLALNRTYGGITQQDEDHIYRYLYKAYLQKSYISHIV